MLSIIVCSVSPKKLEDFKANVEKTIGIKEYEIIAIDNRADKNPIAVVYNKGARLAKYPNLLLIRQSTIRRTGMETLSGVLPPAGAET